MIITVHAKPGSHETKIISWIDKATLIIAISAPPIEGKANKELIKFLAKRTKTAKSLIEIRRGQKGRVKHVYLPDQSYLQLQETD